MTWARAGAARILLGLTVAAGCGSESVDPLAPAVHVQTQEPGRDLAVARGPSGGRAIALALELRDAVRIFEETGGELSSWGDVAVGVGPRSIAVAGDDLVTADATGGTLSRVSLGAGGFAAVTSEPTEPPPFHVASVDAATVVVVHGTGDAAAVRLWTLPVEPVAPLPLANPLPLAGATLAVVAPRGILILRRLTGDVVTLTAPETGELGVAATTSVCDQPRAAAPLLGGEVAVACADRIAFLDGSRPALAYQGNLYDLVAVDLDLDGAEDLAAVDLAAHAAVVWYGDATEPRLYPLSRGPIALRPADLAGDGDLDLIVLAFEARAFDVLENLSKGEQP